MRYRLSKDIVIKSENAAKPEAQACRSLSAYIERLSPVRKSFDYGCGKLRYVKAILSTTDTLSIVDSEIQLARKQKIFGKETTARNVVRTSNRLEAINVTEFSRSSEVFDRAFCINVLSVVPYFAARERVLALVRQKLRAGGTCLFVVQYRNSDFTRMRNMPNARCWRDGFLIDSLRGYSFYGLISPQRLREMVGGLGFEIVDEVLDDGRVYLMTRSPQKPTGRIEVVSETNFVVRKR